MVTFIHGGRGRDVRNEFELEAGCSETARARFRHLVRKRFLLVGSYALLLCIFLAMVGFYYMERREIYGIQLPSLSLPYYDDSVAHDPTQPLPRHPHYIVFEPPASSDVVADRPLRSSFRLPEDCLETHLALGYPCFNNTPATFDIVWTWVNGSDHRLQEAMRDAAVVQYPKDEGARRKLLGSNANPDSKLYRDHDELRHSFRSVLKHFRHHTNHFHLFTSDVPFSVDEFIRYDSPSEGHVESTSHHVTRAEGDSDENDAGDDLPLESTQAIAPRNRTLRLGQLPSWLRTEEQGLWSDGDVEVKVAYQAQVFQNYTGTSFNSYSIESQLPYLPDIEQNFIYLNDDFFFTGDLYPSDFYTSVYGVVLRLDPSLQVDPVAANSKSNPAGEWGPLRYSNWLLSTRFGTRTRPYPIHAAKSFSKPLLDEVARIWADEFRATAAHKFRGMQSPETGAADAYMSFMLTHMVVERWREALLWSWVVGRVGGNQDEWGAKEKHVAWEELGGDPEDTGRKVNVELTQRKSMEKDRVSSTLKANGHNVTSKTRYTFSSADGYPYSYTNPKGKLSWPQYSGDSVGQKLCTIDFETCIGTASSANEAFKTIAFDKPSECGDCIISALRSSSGVLGLSAFLPLRSREFSPSVSPSLWRQLLKFTVGDGSDDGDALDEEDVEDEPLVPHLPLVKDWKEGNFSLQAVLDPYGAVNVRTWTMRLMERYRFVIGDTNVVFLMIEGPNSARSGLNRVKEDVALLCMNDDVASRHQLTDRIIRDWQEQRWQQPAKWER